ncbi:unnamed protein product, partial [Phaeothamnion confervicola]
PRNCRGDCFSNQNTELRHVKKDAENEVCNTDNCSGARRPGKGIQAAKKKCDTAVDQRRLKAAHRAGPIPLPVQVALSTQPEKMLSCSKCIAQATARTHASPMISTQ